MATKTIATKTITVYLTGDIPSIGKEGAGILIGVRADGQPQHLMWRRFLADGSATLTTKKPPASAAGESTGG